MGKGVLCDTSFFIRLLDKSSDLHQSAKDYFRYFLDQDYHLMISTISIAEYAVGGSISGLPLKNLQILPFNYDHAKRTGQFAKAVFAKKSTLKLAERNLIPNDSKLFAQADVEKNIGFYLTSRSDLPPIMKSTPLGSSSKFLALKFYVECWRVTRDSNFNSCMVRLKVHYCP